MYFDTRVEPAGFNHRLRERVAQIHLRISRRQRVLPRRWQHLEERVVAVVVPRTVARRPEVAGAQPRTPARACPAMAGFDREAGGAMWWAVPVARSEERRVGKECRSRWPRSTSKKNSTSCLSTTSTGCKP